MSFIKFIVGKSYNFQTYSSAVLGLEHKGLKCAGVLSFDAALRLYPNILETYLTVYVDLPPGTINNPALSTFFIFKDDNGNSFYYADVWVKPESVVEVKRQVQFFTISDVGLTSGDAQRIMRLLNSAGYSQVNYEIKYEGS